MPAFVGVREIVVLLAVLLLVFGAKRLPELGRALGRGMREFKDGITSRSGTDGG
jgi:sec-independent protein translocase protein TatA